jgi:hypothetical protein
MDDNNYLDLSEADKDRYVYRIISTARLYELFANHENVLVRPSMWEDPFENFILNAPAKLGDGTVVRFEFNNSYYGQCWTLTAASDAMWRIYSPNSDGVRIRTTIRKLATSLSYGLGQWAHIQAFIGKVQYLSDKALFQFANNVFVNGLNSTALARTLLVKRFAFKHERELRLLYSDNDNAPANNLFRYAIDPHALVDQIMIDPRLPSATVDVLKKQIRDTTGFKGSIKRSLLYALPKNMIFPIGN